MQPGDIVFYGIPSDAPTGVIARPAMVVVVREDERVDLAPQYNEVHDPTPHPTYVEDVPHSASPAVGSWWARS